MIKICQYCDYFDKDKIIEYVENYEIFYISLCEKNKDKFFLIDDACEKWKNILLENIEKL